MNIVVVDSHREYADFLVENINRKNRVLQSAIAFDDFPNDIEFYKNIDLVIFDIDSKNSFRVIQKIKEIKSTYHILLITLLILIAYDGRKRNLKLITYLYYFSALCVFIRMLAGEINGWKNKIYKLLWLL